MKRFYRLVVILVVASLLAALSAPQALSQPAGPSALERLRAASGDDLEITWNPLTKTPSFIRGHVPLPDYDLAKGATTESRVLAFLELYGGIVGIVQPSRELRVESIDIDDLGMTHVTLQQVYRGVPVHNALLQVHLSGNGNEVVAMDGLFIPDLRLPGVKPRVAGDVARGLARELMPAAKLMAGPELAVYAPPEILLRGGGARLAWLVEMRDDNIPARTLYVFDANDGSLVHTLDRLYEGRNRRTYNANHLTILPGTLVRSEGQGPVGDEDIDDAHNFAGAVYDYYFNTHSRDSYDNAGATIVSTAHYGMSYKNAFWNGSQMVYGDGFSKLDVVAHELTHAVTERTANLEYRWQYGALNESISDIFAAMVDRDDWLIGEDLPPDVLGGREAIRDMANPTRFGQPDHVSGWVKTCSDNEGVHTNSGIPNKAYYNVATAVVIGKDKAERIFFRALTVYLHATSSLEDARAAALQAAQDLYVGNNDVRDAVANGFNAVGLDGSWNPETNDCVCAVETVLADKAAYPDVLATVRIAGTLYRLRDQLLSRSAVGQHYRTLYEQHTARISYLLAADATLRSMMGSVLAQFTPGFAALLDGSDQQAVITQKMATDLDTMLARLAAADRSHGGGTLAAVIEQEMKGVDVTHLVGMTFDEAWAYLRKQR